MREWESHGGDGEYKHNKYALFIPSGATSMYVYERVFVGMCVFCV